MLQKVINSGAKQTGKIAGGMFFSGNTTQITNTPVQNAWVRVGNGNTNHPLFTLMAIQPVSAPSTSGINDYFAITATTDPAQTQNQRLSFLGKRGSLECFYSLSLQVTGFGPPATPVNFSSRISYADRDGVITNLAQSVRTFRFTNQSTPILHVFPVVVPTQSSFYLEISRLDAVGDADSVLVREAYISLVE